MPLRGIFPGPGLCVHILSFSGFFFVTNRTLLSCHLFPPRLKCARSRSSRCSVHCYRVNFMIRVADGVLLLIFMVLQAAGIYLKKYFSDLSLVLRYAGAACVWAAAFFIFQRVSRSVRHQSTRRRMRNTVGCCCRI